MQRLVGDIGPRGFTPGQLLRAYVVDNQIAFWTERYRDHYVRPADWIVNVSRGAKYRFVQNVSEEAKKIALRSAEVIGLRIGVVDLIRTGRGDSYVLEVDTDGYHMLIDRQFKSIPEYRDFFDLDRYIAEALLVEPEIPKSRRAMEEEEVVTTIARTWQVARRTWPEDELRATLPPATCVGAETSTPPDPGTPTARSPRARRSATRSCLR